MSGTLVLVGTPLGNLDDVTPRMRAALADADVVLCEDTRHSGRLLQALGLEARLVAHHDHNEARNQKRVLDWLRAGQTIALISDAGLPLVSDPGFPLVRAALDAGVELEAVPGPSAAVLALVLSGQPPLPHAVFGFLPKKGRRRAAREIAAWPHTAVLFVSPHRGADELAALAEACGPDRPAALARELTKRFEQVWRGPIGDLAARVAADPPKGEWTLVLGPGADPAAAVDEARLLDEIRELDAARGVGLKAASREIAEHHNVAWRPLYKAVLAADDDENAR